MTARQQRFIAEYLVDLCATKAAHRAGYSKTTGNRQAAQLMTMPHIKAAIAERMAEKAKELDITATNVLRELSLIAFASGERIFPKIVDGKVKPPDIDALTPDERRTINSVTISKSGVKIQRESKIQALELIGKYLALWTDRTEHTGDDASPIFVVGAKAGPA